MPSTKLEPENHTEPNLNSFEKWILENRKFNPTLFFIILCFLKAGTIFLQEDLLGYRADFFVDISGIGDPDASAMMSIMWGLKIGLGYLSIPIYYLMKFFTVALILWLGAFGFGYRIGLNFFFRLAMVSQVVFFIPDFFKIFYFGFFSPEYGMDAFNEFQPLALVGYLDIPNSSALLINFAQWMSIPEFIYIYLLALGIKLKYQRSLQNSFYLVALSYIPASLFWIFFYSVVFS